MPKIQYEAISFKPWKMEIIDTANTIVAEYAEQGYTMTLRQVYYQFVARDLLPEKWADPATGSTNNARSYDKLGQIIADARLAGLMDWEAIVDRTREMGGNTHWRSPESIIDAVARQYRPPENPAKSTDSRFAAYRDAHGDASWELDALDPNVIANLIGDRVRQYRDDDRFAAMQAQEERERQLLGRTSDRWADVVELVSV